MKLQAIFVLALLACAAAKPAKKVGAKQEVVASAEADVVPAVVADAAAAVPAVVAPVKPAAPTDTLSVDDILGLGKQANMITLFVSMQAEWIINNRLILYVVVGEDDDAEDDEAAEDETADDDDDDILGLGGDDDDDDDAAADDAGPFGLLGGDLFAGLFDDTPATKKPKVTPVVEAVAAVATPIKEVKPVVVNRVRRRPDTKKSTVAITPAAAAAPVVVATDSVPAADESVAAAEETIEVVNDEVSVQ